jgi:hypothetical protein
MINDLWLGADGKFHTKPHPALSQQTLTIALPIDFILDNRCDCCGDEDEFRRRANIYQKKAIKTRRVAL